jgi:AcrR family transcriptional regulator
LSGLAPGAPQRLLLAGIEAFASRGYHATSTREIAARAGLSPAALYVHYASKIDLLAAIIKMGHASALAEFERGFTEDGPAERVAAAVWYFTVWHAENQMLARVVQYELESLGDEQRREVGELRTKFEHMLRSEINRGIDAGVFVVDDVASTATAIFSLCIDVARWYSRHRRRRPEDIGRLYGTLALRMLTGHPGPRSAKPQSNV